MAALASPSDMKSACPPKSSSSTLGFGAWDAGRGTQGARCAACRVHGVQGTGRGGQRCGCALARGRQKGHPAVRRWTAGCTLRCTLRCTQAPGASRAWGTSSSVTEKATTSCAPRACTRRSCCSGTRARRSCRKESAAAAAAQGTLNSCCRTRRPPLLLPRSAPLNGCGPTDLCLPRRFKSRLPASCGAVQYRHQCRRLLHVRHQLVAAAATAPRYCACKLQQPAHSRQLLQPQCACNRSQGQAAAIATRCISRRPTTRTSPPRPWGPQPHPATPLPTSPAAASPPRPTASLETLNPAHAP
jgi:hypothetical protein